MTEPQPESVCESDALVERTTRYQTQSWNACQPIARSLARYVWVAGAIGLFGGASLFGLAKGLVMLKDPSLQVQDSAMTWVIGVAVFDAVWIVALTLFVRRLHGHAMKTAELIHSRHDIRSHLRSRRHPATVN